jgi:hypothetical protein
VSDLPVITFPPLPNYEAYNPAAIWAVGFSYKQTLVFTTPQMQTFAGREAFSYQNRNPTWRFELTFPNLRDETENQALYEQWAGITEFQQIANLFFFNRGPSAQFLFDYPFDHSRTGLEVAIADGFSTGFFVPRIPRGNTPGITLTTGVAGATVVVENIYGFTVGDRFQITMDDSSVEEYEVGSILGSAQTLVPTTPVTGTASGGNPVTCMLVEPVGAVNVDKPVNVYLNDVLQSESTYDIDGNQIVFETAPAAGDVITADFWFYFLCHFVEDTLTLSETLKDLWELKKLVLETVAPDNVPTVTFTPGSVTEVCPSPTPPPAQQVLWGPFAISGDNSTIVAISPGYITDNNPVTYVEAGLVYVSTDGGSSWTKALHGGSYVQAFADEGGDVLVVFDQNGSVYISANSGANWITQVPSAGSGYEYAAASADCTKLFLIDASQNLWRSTDTGGSWTNESGFNSPYSSCNGYSSIVSSSDGTVVTASALGFDFSSVLAVFRQSTDGGVTWVNLNLDNVPELYSHYGSLTCDSTGENLAFADIDVNYIYTSSDGGTAWTEQTASGNTSPWNGIFGSSSGAVLSAIPGSGSTAGILVSADSGSTWTGELTYANNDIPSLTSNVSPDGTRLFAGVGAYDPNAGAGFWFSADGGTTWTLVNPI